MSRLFPKLALPLLARELTERAASKRTYIVRAIFALLLMTAFWFFASKIFNRYGGGATSVLGSGQWLFELLVIIQLMGIFLFLPAMMAGQFTIEKERDSLGLLFLTRLGPWQILFEKYLSGLIPIFSLLLLAMPLGAIAYAFGGVTQTILCHGIYFLFLTSLQVGALALMCSTWCRTTASAFIATCVIGTILYCLPAFIDSLLGPLIGHTLSAAFRDRTIGICPFLIAVYKWHNVSISVLLQQSALAWISTVLFLVLARCFLVRRAFVKGTNPVLVCFRWLDGRMQRLNRVTGNIRIGKSGGQLPDAHPIAWRETRKNVLARPHYLLRILLAVEVPTICYGFVLLLNWPAWPQQSRIRFLWFFITADNLNADLTFLNTLLGALAVLVVSVAAANAFVSERVQQTLDVLLTTPMSAAQIVAEKARAMRPFLAVVAAPVMTLFLMQWNVKIFTGYLQLSHSGAWLYLICSLLTLAVYLPLVSWLSLWIGLKMRTRFRAIITALMVILIWCVAPLLVPFFVSDAWGWVSYLSPLYLPVINEFRGIQWLAGSFAWLTIGLNFSVFGAILYFIRRRCLSCADRYLRQA
ncbi:MAG: gliding motility-associated transporter permease protein [Chthoniobacteraceae bacterium]|nr:gliding motility-associated transporter permease protein [Chthoniobacteraceae bacterium]